MHKKIQRLISSTLIGFLLFALIPSQIAFANSYEYDQGFYDQGFEINSNRLKTQDGFNGNTWSGSFTYTLAIEVPPGRNGMEPNLNLTYSSQNNDVQNIFGYGWSMDIPFISRLTKKGVDTLYTEEYFTSSFEGELVDVSLTSESYGTYASQVEGGAFLDYEYDSSGYWTATDKGGTVYTFGSSTDTQQNNPSDSTQIYRWMLEEIRDTNDNYVSFEYTKDDGQIYPDVITYTGNGTSDGIFTVEFGLESRSDAMSSYHMGFDMQTNYRINEIKTYVDGYWVRDYDLAYTNGDNGVRSMLENITKSARNSDGDTITLEPTEFDYETSVKNWTEDVSYSIPCHFYHSGENSYKGIEIIDVDGNGLVDLVESYSDSTGVQRVYINDGDSFTQETGYTIPSYFWEGSGNWMKNVRAADVNGDGFIDLIRSGDGTQAVYINNGDSTGWTQDTGYSIPFYFNTGYMNDEGVRLFDVNGDGMTDFVKATPTYQAVYINNGDGTGWTQDTGYSIPLVFYSSGDSHKGADIIDVNGDGLTDLIESYNSVQSVYINNGDGTGWTQDTGYSIPVSFWESYGNQMKNVRLADVNGDNLTDLIQSGDGMQVIYINNGDGTGWTQDTGYSVPFYFNTGYMSEEGVRLFDINGDGMIDFVKSNRNTESAFINDTPPSDLLINISNSHGSTTSISYESSIEQDNPNLPFIMQVVSEVTTDDGLGNESTVTYEYEGGEFYYESEYEKQFAGFDTITKTEEDRVTETLYHQGDEDRSKIGHVYETNIYDEWGNLYQTKLTEWENYDLAYDNDFVYKSQSVVMNYDGGSSHRDKAITYEYDMSNGNLEETTDYGEVTANTDGSFTDLDSTDNLTSSLTYAIDAGGIIENAISTEVLTDYLGSTLASTMYYYDDLAHGSVDTGNLTIEAYYLDTDGSWPSTDYSVNSYGLIDSTTNPRGYSTTISYDSYNLYPNTVTNELGHEIDYTYDYTSGQIASETNANAYTSEYTYDGLGRILDISVPDPTSGSTTQFSSTVYYDSVVPSYSVTTTTVDGILMESRAYYDGLERVIEEWSPSESGHVVIEYSYDEMGNIDSQSLPYSSSNVGTIYYAYDPLGRLSSESSPVGTTSHSYSLWVETVTDANGNAKTFTFDARGQMVQVDEYNDADTYTTDYEYDLLGPLLQITDAQGNEREFTFDSLGRKTSQEDLHDSAEANPGVWTYTYDENGNVLTQTDPSSQVIAWAYDELDRAESEDWDDNSSFDITYTYDTATNGIGMLAESITSDLDTSYSYDAQGNIASETKTLDASTYIVTTTYDLLGRTIEVNYPDSAANVTYTYNAGGGIETVSKDGGEIISDLDYAEIGQAEYIEYGNGTTTTNTYNGSQNYRLTEKITTGTYDERPIDAYMEIGVAEGVDENWVTVTLENTYENPVVIASYHEDANSNPISVRIRNAGSTSFDVRLQEAINTNPDSSVDLDDVYYMVIEEGEWTFGDDNLKIEAGLLDTSLVSSSNNAYSGEVVGFDITFDTDPLVMHQVQTSNDEDWISSFVSRNNNPYGTPTTSEMWISLAGAQVTDSHNEETIGWVAFEGDFTGIANGTSFETINIGTISSAGASASFQNGTLSDPRVIVGQFEMGGSDGSWPVIDSIDSSGFAVHAEEDVVIDTEQSHSAENMGYFATSGDASIGLYNQNSPAPKMEVGSLTTDQGSGVTMEVDTVSGVDENWTSVTFTNTDFTDPVVVASHTATNNTDPASVRIRNINSIGFEVSIQNPSGTDLATETIQYFAVERGQWTIDGYKIEADSADTSTVGSASIIGGTWAADSQSYMHTYSAQPIVMHQVQTENDSDWISSWISLDGNRAWAPDSNGFQIGLNGAEVASTHGTETVGWIVIDKDVEGEIGGVSFETKRHDSSVAGYDDGYYAYSYVGIDSVESFSLVSQQKMSGGDGGWSVFYSQDASSIGIYTDEDQVNDTERNHSFESVGTVTFSDSLSLTQDDGWSTVSLTQSYDSPVIVITGFENNLTVPVSARIQNVSADSFEITLQDPDGTTGFSDDIHYMVVEEGQWQMGGTKIEAHLTEVSTVGAASIVDGTWDFAESQTYDHTFLNEPLVLHQVMSFDDANWINSWVSLDGNRAEVPDQTGFQLGLNGTEVTSTHTPETVAWIAIENDGADDYEGVDFTTDAPSVEMEGYDDGCYTYTYGDTYIDPIVLASQMGMDGADGSWLWGCSLSTTDAGFCAQEDQKSNDERNHSSEALAYIAFDSEFSAAGDPALETVATGNVQDLTYTYDNVGNITDVDDISITATAKSLTYTYDDLNRLLTANSSGYAFGDYSMSYLYDEVGNMTYKSDIGTMLYEGTGGSSSPIPHAVTSVDGTAYTYDSNGNLTDDGTNIYSWDINNRLSSSGDMEYIYGPSGSRIKTLNNSTGEETVYVNSYMEIRDEEPVYYIFAGNIRVASFEDDGASGHEITYFHQDHLGGTALSTDENGFVSTLMDYLPYGSELANESLGDGDSEIFHSFTDKELEEELGLYYFEARWYNSDTAKFGSLDPAQYDNRVFSMITDPQSFNAYAYSRNNPIVLVDPDGEFWNIVIGAAAGATVGAVGQAITDISRGEFSGAQSYASATAGGAVSGALVSTGIGIFYAGAVGGAVTETINQAFDNGITNINIGSVAEEAVVGGVISVIAPTIKIKGLTSGKNSFSAIKHQITTKLGNKTIENISASTGAKMYSSELGESILEEGISAGITVTSEAIEEWSSNE